MPLTRYMRTKLRTCIVASGIWTLTYEKLAAPCDMCPPVLKIVCRTTLHATYFPKPYDTTGIRVCHLCLGALHLKRERDKQWAMRKIVKPTRKPHAKR